MSASGDHGNQPEFGELGQSAILGGPGLRRGSRSPRVAFLNVFLMKLVVEGREEGCLVNLRRGDAVVAARNPSALGSISDQSTNHQ